MSARPIGYYVHHQGEGHRRRAMAIAAEAGNRLVLIGTGVAALPGAFDRLDLPDDRRMADAAFDGLDAAESRPSSLHYAPLNHEGVRARTAAVASWIARERPALMVVDVSVEIAMLARLCSTPTVYVRLAGNRYDLAHLDAFRGARALLAPFHADLDEPTEPFWVRNRTRYIPGLTMAGSFETPEDDVVLAVFGRGGGGVVDGAALADAARATPHLLWRAIGPVRPPANMPGNLKVLGWVADPDTEIARAAVVIGGAGDGLVNAVCAAGRPFVCLPERRAYGEQDAKAARLAALNAAVVCRQWPDANAWHDLIRRAKALGAAGLKRLHDPAGPAKAAAFLLEAAGQ